MRGSIAHGVAAVSSLAFWAIVNVISGTREPWDAPSYWSVSYPLAITLSAVLGFLFIRRAWMWGLIVVFSQLPVMVAWGAAVGPLLLVGVMLLTITSLPAVAAAVGAARVKSLFAARGAG